MLTSLGILRMSDILQMNALTSLFALCINGMAAILFMVTGGHYGVGRSPGIRGGQFDRSASIGSILDARQAGMYPATAATTISTAPTPR